MSKQFLDFELEGDWEQGLDRMANVVKTRVIRTGGNTMAYVFQTEAKALAPVLEHVPPSKVGKVHPGQLRDSIYRVNRGAETDTGRAVYEVSWNHYKAPHGHWVEFGNSVMGAQPFVRPAYEAAKFRAISAGLERMKVKYSEAMSTGAIT